MTRDGRRAFTGRHAPGASQAAAGLMSVCYAIALFHRTAFQAVEPSLRDEFGLSGPASADLAATFFWTYLVVMIPTGLAADAFGARRLAVAGSLVVALGSLLFALADSVWTMFAARVLLAAGSAAAFVALMRFIALNFADRKATYSGRGILLGNLGAIASGAPLAILLASTAWRTVWLGLALASLAFALAIARIAPRIPPARAGTPVERDPLAELRSLLRSRSVHVGIALQAGLAGGFYAFGNVIAPRWLAAHGLGRVETGWAVSVLIAGYGIGAAFWGWIGDAERQRTRALLLACGIALSCWIALAFDPWASPGMIALFLFVSGMSCGAFVLVYALISERHPPSEAGGVIACVNCGIPLGAALIQTLAGRVAQASAPLLLIGASAVALGCALRLFGERGARERGAMA